MAGFFRRIGMLVGRERFRAELDEEMTFHREEAQRRFEAEGMGPSEARRVAAQQFGNPLKLQEQSHEVVGFWLESVWQDVRYGVRQMLRAPGFTLAVVLTLALGIGANTAMFSVVEATLLRPLPYRDAGEIVRIEDEPLRGASVAGLTGVPRVFDLKARSKSFDSLTWMYVDTPTMIVGGRLPEHLDGASVSGQFWRVFGAQPMLGRVFDEREDRSNSAGVIVLSYAAWLRLFGGDPSVVGRAVTVDRQAATIIGVMPQNFNYPTKTDIWKPAQLDPAQWSTYRGDGTRWANVFARLKPSVTQAAAANELKVIGARLAAEHPQTDAAWQFKMLTLQDYMYGSIRPALLILLAASSVLLLIGCLNVGNLILSRATTRQREVALRQALGASQSRIVRQLVTESVLLALTGGAVGLGSAILLMQAAGAWQPELLNWHGKAALNWQVVSFALIASLGVGILLGLIPAFTNRRGDLTRCMKSGEVRVAGTAGNRLRSSFIAVQVGLSLVLLVSACLLVESLWKLTQSPLGFRPDHVLTFELKLPWNTDTVVVENFYAGVQRGIEALPGVKLVGQTSALPTVRWQARGSYDVDWKPRTSNKDAISVENLVIAGNYLQALNIPLLEGRALREKDTGLLVNREFVRQYLQGASPLGRHILRAGGNGATEAREIVGVTGDVRGTAGSIASEVQPEVYEEANGYQVGRSFALRSLLPPEQLIPAVRALVHTIDPQQSIGEVNTLDAMISHDVSAPRLNMALLVGFAAIALLLACVGIYGVVAYSVAQRRQEIGVRMALGAPRREICMLFLQRTLVPAGIGLSGGVVAALGLTRLLSSQLYGVSATDGRIFAISVVLLMLPVLLASLRPALQAAALNPTDALRAE